MVPQPTEKREEANAAYLLRKQIQGELARLLVASAFTKFEEIDWAIDRWRSAVKRELRLEAEAQQEHENG